MNNIAGLLKNVIYISKKLSKKAECGIVKRFEGLWVCHTGYISYFDYIPVLCVCVIVVVSSGV